MNTNTLIPTRRFPNFTGAWKVKKYGDACNFYTTNSLSRANLNYTSGKVKNIHYGDIHKNFQALFDLRKEHVPFINSNVNLAKVKKTSYCQEGDLIIADASEDYTAIGKTIEIIALNGEKLLAGLHTFLARPNPNVFAKGFAAFLVQSWKVRKQIMWIAQGTKVLGISIKSLSTVKLITPSLPEQQKIGNFLASIDQRINNLRQQLHLWQRYKKGLLQQIFSRQLRFKPANSVNYPKWEVKQLGKLCQIQRGSSPRPISSPQWFNPNSSVGWVRISDVTKSHRTLLKTQQYLSDKGIEKSKFVRKGNLIMSICATIGKPIFTGFDVCIHDGFVVFNNLTINKIFMYYLLEKIEKRWYKYGQHGIQVNLNTTIVSTEKVVIPSLAEQQQIGTFLSSIDAKIARITKRLAASQAFKKGILQQLFV